jgi:WD40 repeat protein
MYLLFHYKIQFSNTFFDFEVSPTIILIQNCHIDSTLAGGNTIEKIHRGAHEGGVFSICFLQNGTFVSGGGKDGVLREWDSNTHEPSGRELEVSFTRPRIL